MLTIEELKSKDCRWPGAKAKTGEILYCGEPAVDGCPYCAAHAAIAYSKPAARWFDQEGCEATTRSRLPFELESRS